ncbi:MAG TPA: HYExAFE family protein [Phycisphaerales bacterium]|nr:HYExAFE family protein [Phycisphaerales bacterium]
MAQRRHHYETAFERLLRDRRIPYVAVDEARKSLLPDGAPLRLASGEGPERSLKSFDFVLYGEGSNLLAEVKGRRYLSPRSRPGPGRLESWVNAEDVDSLLTWQRLFGPEFAAAFIFVYWCVEQPPDGLFEDVFEHRARWYALRVVMVEDYARLMRVRSRRWGTVHLDAASFDLISRPFASGAGLWSPPVAPAFEPLGVVA